MSILSVVPYYGGKAKMAKFISDLLDYRETDVYVELFGGGARVLLNKPRHKAECYNDLGVGISTLMNVLSDKEKVEKLICKLDETEISEKCFLEAKEVLYKVQTSVIEKVKNEYLQEFKRLYLKYNPECKSISNEKLNNLAHKKESIKDIIIQIKNEPEDIRKKYIKKIEKLYYNYRIVDLAEEESGRSIDDPMQIEFSDIPDIDIAAATFVVYQQSMYAMGQNFSKDKIKSDNSYKKRIAKLYDCATRMEGVLNFNVDAFAFFRHYFDDNDNEDNSINKYNDDVSIDYENLDDLNKKLGNELDETGLTNYYINKWISNPRVMMYLDPSYISPDSEKEMLEGINWENETCLWKAICNKYKNIAIEKEIEKLMKKLNVQYKDIEAVRKKVESKFAEDDNLNLYDKYLPKNLGKIYTASFNYEDHENFVKCISNAKCKILVSNYDIILYDKYLTKEKGWRRIEYETTTSVGGKKNNRRREVLWYNY